MQPGYAVDAVAGRHAEVGHADHAALDDGRALDIIGVAGGAPDLVAEPVVDLGDDLVDAGQTALEEVDLPAFQGLPHDRVVGVSRGAGD